MKSGHKYHSDITSEHYIVNMCSFGSALKLVTSCMSVSVKSLQGSLPFYFTHKLVIYHSLMLSPVSALSPLIPCRTELGR